MHAYIRRGLYGTLTAGGFLLLGAVGAVADTSGDNGAASGTQVIAPAIAPVSADGNAVSVLGRSSTTNNSGASSGAPSTSDGSGATTSGTRGIGSGSQVVAPVNAPVSADGNAISVLGRSSTTKASSNSAPEQTERGAGGSGTATSGTGGIGSGTQVVAPVSAPMSVEGNSVSVLGSSSTGGMAPENGTSGTGETTAAGKGSPDTTTSGRRSLAGGTQVTGPVNAPASADGNAIAVLGTSSTSGSGTESRGRTRSAFAPGNIGSGYGSAGYDSSGATTSGNRGAASGTQIVAPVSAALSADGNSLTVLGDALTGSGTGGPTRGGEARPGSSRADASGSDGVGQGDGSEGVGSADGTAGQNACVATISLASAPGQGVAKAGVGDIDVGSTALSAALCMLLGASMASVFRRKRSQAVKA